MSPDRKRLAASQDEIMGKNKFYKLSMFDLRNKTGMEVFGTEFAYYVCT